MRKFTSKRSALLAIAGILAVSAAAIAYWTQGGTGSGSGTAGNTVAVTVVQVGAPSGLYPDGPAQPLAGTITNPNAHAVNIHEITAEVTSVTGGGTDPGQPACSTDDFEIGGTAGPYVAAADDTTAWSGLTLQMVDNNANQDNCKGATAVITYTADATA